MKQQGWDIPIFFKGNLGTEVGLLFLVLDHVNFVHTSVHKQITGECSTHWEEVLTSDL